MSEQEQEDTICEHCGSDDAELRDCNHTICEDCFTGECAICMEPFQVA